MKQAETGLGLIGCGGFARMIAKAVRSLPEIKVLALVDKIQDRARNLKEEYGFTEARVSSDPADVLGRPDISIVAIATPPHSHEELSLAAISAGQAVFCEKPGALSAASALKIARTAEEKGVTAVVDLVMRQNPLCLILGIIVRSGILGEIERLEVENYAHDERLPVDHWFWDKHKSGGIWIEHGVHFFDLVNFVLDQTAPEWIWASGFVREVPADKEGPDNEGKEGKGQAIIEDRVMAVAWYPRGTVVSFYHGFKRPERYERTITRVVGSKGYSALYGWMPMRLEVEVFPNSADMVPCKNLLSEAADFGGSRLHALQPAEMPDLYLVHDIEITDTEGKYEIEGKYGTSVSSTGLGSNAGCVRGSYQLGPDRRMVYAGCVRAGLRDLIRATPIDRPAADYATVARALTVAEAAEASHRKIQSVRGR
ncbi:MAG TPA: Gfo/Idh/MocA family oxidoreductase [Clostridia bacterium]|nr:Gfo/Idh/MocA family oxidoreductase [Clostridia bacterium]